MDRPVAGIVRRRRDRLGRLAYVLMVTAFTAALGPTVVSAVNSSSGEVARSAAIPSFVGVLLVLFGLATGLIGSLLLDVLLLLATRTTGTHRDIRQSAPLVDRELPALAAGVAVAAGWVLVAGAPAAFASPWPSVAMGAAVLAHLALLFRALAAAGLPARRRLAALAVYAAVPAALLILGRTAR